MKLKRTGLVRVGAWILTGLLAADIGLQLGGVEIGSKWEWREMGRRFSERLLKGAVNQANLAAFYYDGKQKKYRVAEYMPSPEDLEAVAEENTAVLLEDMAGENSEAVRKAQEDSERAETESEAGTEYVETLVGVPTGEIYSEKALMDYDFLLGHFYTVDPTTLANSKLINGTDLLQKDLTIDLDGAEPKILIYHTHSQEGYADSEAGNADDTVVGVGEQLKKVLEESGEMREEVLDAFGIERAWLDRFPRELSGGELQRFCVARALMSGADFLICDEISTMLDVITQAQIWNVVLDEAKNRNMGIIAVTHNKHLANRIADRVYDLSKQEYL